MTHLYPFLITFIFVLAECLTPIDIQAQTVYSYPLNGTLNEATGSSSPLGTWPNAAGQTGTFTSTALPATTCGGIGQFSGYDYANNAGLRFDNPPGFITCAYTIQFTWKYDNPGGFQEWIRILSFAYTDDSGLEIWTEPPSINGTIYYWHLTPIPPIPFFPSCLPDYEPLSPAGYFNEADYYQMTITRSCTDFLSVYANGVYLGGFMDSDQRYVPDPTSQQIVFFRDTVDVSGCYFNTWPDEASSGFISNLVIADYAFSASDIATDFGTFCPSLLPIYWQYIEASRVSGGNELLWSVETPEFIASYEVQKSEDGQYFSKIATISPEANGSITSGDFSYLDEEISSKKQYYRILATDLEGQVSYSRIQEISHKITIQIYPNPTSGNIWISSPERMEWEILNSQSKVLSQFKVEPGRNAVSLDAYPAGVLFFRSEKGQVFRIVKAL